MERKLFAKWYALDKETQKNILRANDGWIIRNLLEYRNCLIPNKTIHRYGIEQVEKRLSDIIGEYVAIDERLPEDYGIMYIAEVIEHESLH